MKIYYLLPKMQPTFHKLRLQNSTSSTYATTPHPHPHPHPHFHTLLGFWQCLTSYRIM
ncbi:hypothetical protein HanHA300_Chr00c0749g0809151 [Helianthus annuus]|nr:hypothetical protein HanHA300_Chr00c0749g0809151 [Helianthus annuus]